MNILFNFIVSVLILLPNILWNDYKDETNHYVIKYPIGWEQKKINQISMFISPKESDTDSYQENVNIIVQNLKQLKLSTLDEYVAFSKRQITEKYAGSSFIYIKDDSLNNYKGKEMLYLFNYRKSLLKIKQNVFFKDGNAYLFTFTAKPGDFDKYNVIASELMLSFRFVD
jgi:hypothetical protein